MRKGSRTAGPEAGVRRPGVGIRVGSPMARTRSAMPHRRSVPRRVARGSQAAGSRRQLRRARVPSVLAPAAVARLTKPRTGDEDAVDESPHRSADARSRPPDHRGRRHAVAGPHGERGTASRVRHRSGVRRPRRPAAWPSSAAAATTAATASSSRALLRQRGVHVSVFLVGRAGRRAGRRLDESRAIRAAGAADRRDRPASRSGNCTRSEVVASRRSSSMRCSAPACRSPLSGLLAEMVEDVNRAGVASAGVAIDLPSGLSADTHDVIGPAIERDAHRHARRAEAAARAVARRAAWRATSSSRTSASRTTSSTRSSGARPAPADRRRPAAAGPAARPRHAQGRLRPRARRGRLSREDGRCAPGRHGRAAHRGPDS